MRPGLFTYQVSDIPFTELLVLAQECGLRTLELGVAGVSCTPGLESDKLLASAEARSELLDALRAHGLEISALNAMCNPLHPRAEVRDAHQAELRRAMRLAV